MVAVCRSSSLYFKMFYWHVFLYVLLTECCIIIKIVKHVLFITDFKDKLTFSPRGQLFLGWVFLLIDMENPLTLNLPAWGDFFAVMTQIFLFLSDFHKHLSHVQFFQLSSAFVVSASLLLIHQLALFLLCILLSLWGHGDEEGMKICSSAWVFGMLSGPGPHVFLRPPEAKTGSHRRVREVKSLNFSPEFPWGCKFHFKTVYNSGF